MGCASSKSSSVSHSTTLVQAVLPGETERDGREDDAQIPMRATASTASRRRSSIAQVTDAAVEILGLLTGKRRTSALDPDVLTRLRLLKESLCTRKMSIADFEVGCTVGIGTFGRVKMVWLKDHVIRSGPLKGDRTVLALKIINKVKATQKYESIGSAMAAIRQEIRILHELEFPFVVNLITIFHDDARVCLLMEFVNAGELYRLIYKELSCPMPVETTKFFFAEILLALEEIHAKPHFIAYRDLKPENILVSREGHAKLVDFGMAKKLNGNLGRTRTNCGTLQYQAPEILLNKEYTFTVDYWALGVVLFEMLCRRVPWGDKKEPFKISQAIMSQNISWTKDAPKKGRDLVMKFLKFDEAERYGGLKYPVSNAKKHSFVSNIDWEAVLNTKIRTPYKPTVTSDDDTRFFGKYPESNEETGPAMSQKDKKLWDMQLDSVFDERWTDAPVRSGSRPGSLQSAGSFNDKSGGAGNLARGQTAQFRAGGVASDNPRLTRGSTAPMRSANK